jgi:hypothetical protein
MYETTAFETSEKVRFKMKIIWLVILLFCSTPSIHATKEAELLIIGCGGSGTHYTSTCFQISGLDLTHEKFGKYGCIGWPLTVGPFNFDGTPLPNMQTCRRIFHQVRNPLHVIACWSQLDLDHSAWIFVRKHIPEINKDDSSFVQSAKYWYYWNLIAESKAEWRFKVEDFSLLLNEFNERLYISLDEKAILTISTNTGTWAGNKKTITWDDLKINLQNDLYENIRNMAIRYNYL